MFHGFSLYLEQMALLQIFIHMHFLVNSNFALLEMYDRLISFTYTVHFKYFAKLLRRTTYKHIFETNL
jgi:hypothetical protein